jgi:F420 biosynthesis protein FbiB-like protein
MDSSLWHSFWSYIDQLVSNQPLVIDRPQGSDHPNFPGLAYPLDYGYLDGTRAGDGAGIDAWVGSQGRQEVDSLLLTVDINKRDMEIKLLLGCTPADAQTVLEFMNSEGMRAVLIRRDREGLRLLSTRQSVRRFSSQPIPADIANHLLKAAVQAPSAHNRQPWRFAVLTTLASKYRLASTLGADFRRDLLADGLSPAEVETQVERSYKRIVEAPMAVLLCMDLLDMDIYPDATRQAAEKIMAVQSVAMAGQNFLLAAHAEGLGGVWVCAPLFAGETARTALDLPNSWQPQGLLLVGYPAKTPVPRPRKPLDEVVRYL